VNDWGLRWLRRLSCLRCLNLDSRHFSDAGLQHICRLTGLECLDLFAARISDAGCATLSKFSRLRRLEVCGGSVTEAGAAHLAALTGLQHLSLAQNYRLGNGAIGHLLKLNELTALNLSQSRVTSQAVVALGCLPKLQASWGAGSRCQLLVLCCYFGTMANQAVVALGCLPKLQAS
jgi:hypothetical protein